MKHEIEIQPRQSKRAKNTQPQLAPINWHLKGEFAWVSVKELDVPWEQYQRDRKNSKRAHEIALDWNWGACGCLIVILRKDNTHIVADGGTRLAAALLRGDIKELPCMLHEVEDEKQEAEIFRLINVHRDKLKTHEIQHAELFEGRDLALDTQEYLERLGSAGVGFDSLAELRRKLARRYRAFTWKILPILCEIGEGKHLSSRVFKGLVLVEAKLHKQETSLTAKSYLNKLRKHGLKGLETAITALVPPKGGGGTTQIYVRAICNLLRITDKE